MTRTELHQLTTHAQATHGRPINPYQCCACGAAPQPMQPISKTGLCARCEAQRRPTHDVIVLFTSLRKVSHGK